MNQANSTQDRQDRQEKIILQLNKTGLSYLTHQQFSQAFQFFKQSEKVIQNQLRVTPNNIRINKLAGITYNNLACYYKKTNKPKISLIYLQKALEVEIHRVEDWSATASTHLNICAIHSYLKDHQAAARHAELALNMLEKIEMDKDKVDKDKEEDRSIGNLHMLGHYNLAIELEYLKRYEQSIEEFTKAREWAKKLGKKNTGIIMACDQSITRMGETMNHLKDRLVRIVTKKRIEEEKGHYSFMRKNKKNFSNYYFPRQSHGSLPKNIKALKLYEQKPAHYRTKSILRLKTSPKNEGYSSTKNRNTSFSYL